MPKSDPCVPVDIPDTSDYLLTTVVKNEHGYKLPRGSRRRPFRGKQEVRGLLIGDDTCQALRILKKTWPLNGCMDIHAVNIVLVHLVHCRTMR